MQMKFKEEKFPSWRRVFKICTPGFIGLCIPIPIILTVTTVSKWFWICIGAYAVALFIIAILADWLSRKVIIGGKKNV